MLGKKNIKIWWAISKKEFRIFTYRIRKRRKTVLIFISLVLFFWGFYFGPNIITSVFPEIFHIYAYQYRARYSDFLGFLFTICFLINLLVPIYDSYRKSEVDLKELCLSAPIRLNDIFFADFLWRIPFYILVVLILGPLIAGTINLIKILTLAEIFLLYSCLLGNFIFSLLIGSILMVYLERRILNSEKIKKNSAYVIFLITFLIIGFVYLLQFLIFYLQQIPELNFILIIFPSFWYSNIVSYMIDPQLLILTDFNLLLSILASIFIPFIILILYYKKLDKIIEMDKLNAKSDFRKKSVFFSIIEILSIRKWKSLILTQMKEFVRDKENLVKVIFSTATIFISGVVLFLSYDQIKSVDIFQEAGLSDIDIIDLKILAIPLLSWLGSFLIAVLNAVYSFLKSKDLILYYRKSPRGVKALIFSYFFSQIQLIFLIDLVVTFSISLLYMFDILQIIYFFTMFFFYGVMSVGLEIGFQCLNPLFKYKTKIVLINIYYILFIQILSFFIILMILIPLIPNESAHFEVLNQIFLLHLILMYCTFMPIFLFLGYRKLKKIE
jgi:hypothetical protein